MMEDTSEAIHPDKADAPVIQEVWNTFGQLRDWREYDGAYLCHGQKAGAALVFFSPTEFRFKVFGEGVIDLTTTIAVLPPKEIFKPEIEENEQQLQFLTGELTVSIEKQTFALTVTNKEGIEVARQDSLSWSPRGAMSALFTMQDDSHFYGLGEKSSFLDKRGERYTMWNTDVYAPHMPEIEALYESIPLLIHMHSGINYGIFLDNPGRSEFDMRSHGVAYTIGCMTGAYDIYFIYGPELKQVVSRYTALTGRITLPPKWSLGYHQSRYSYMSQTEVMTLARTFREKQIPCDVIYLDIHYMDEYRVFTFDKIRFPDPKGMIAELREMGIRIVPIVDPGVKKDPKYKIYREGVQEEHFCRRLEGDIYFGDVWPGTSAFPDFTETRTAKWWGDLHEFYTSLGIDGIWNDMNEPAIFNTLKTMDPDVMHLNDGDPVTHEEIHNLYGMYMSRATYEGMKSHMNGRRPFVLTRAGYSGIQRYAAIWTGDNRSFWEHMAMAMPMVLNMGLSGLPFAGPDIGGFAYHTSAQLLVRWTQMGVFFPYCRNHSALGTTRQEPWSFGEKVEEIVREYISLRYRWMPHLYNLFYESSQTGMPIMRPLLLEYPHDPKVTNLCDQFLLGPNVIIAPVYRPDTDYRAVYLPEGVWHDYWTGEKHAGGRTILADAPLDVLPIYVRAGGIVAEGALHQYSGDHDSDDVVTFHLYGAEAKPDFRAEYTLYEDDGETFAYESGKTSKLYIRAQGQYDALRLKIQYIEDTYVAKRQHLRFTLRQPGFTPSAIEQLSRITLDELAEGGIGWSLDESSGDILIQIEDRKLDELVLKV
ncbi:TIM-barrel domain-containing protein [Paenibacillus sp. SGZ-1009]|uniref:glycoside hydrolase family 31 protein n=1 Tax=Paenibacillus campi TaxID=3106031 RepID=UPI002AFF64E8|nr:TIM-barrel domain-containing protein [Paenibacillus sp. SGZ-1009]